MPEPSCPPVQFFAGSPRLHQLVALLIVFEKPGDDAPGKQVLRCRELIFRCAAVLASPSDDADSIMVLVPRSFNLNQTLADMRARVLAERPAARDDFACCLRYTLRAKLAPQWNVAGELLLQGRDFLQVTGPINAVRLQVTVTDEDICLSTQACVVRLPRLSLNDLGASPGVLGDFHAGHCDVISERQLTGRWCHILPRMTKGQVATMSRHLLPSGPFASYKDLKRHWKNMYGYRLPEEPPPHYININFRLVGPQLFTYPPVCLRNGPLVFLPRPAPRPILTALLRDLHVKVSTVCGQPLTFSGTPSYLTVQLQPVPMLQADGRPNLSSEPVTRQPPAATRHVSLSPAVRPGPPTQQRATTAGSGAQRVRGPRSPPPGAGQTPDRPPPPPRAAPPAPVAAIGQQTASPRVSGAGRPQPTSRPPPVSSAPSLSIAAERAAFPSAAALSVPTAASGLISRSDLLPRSPRPGQVASCLAASSHTGAAMTADTAATPCSPRPARVVPVFKPRCSAAATRPSSVLARAPAAASRPAGAGKQVPARPAGAGKQVPARPAGAGKQVPARPAGAGGSAPRRPESAGLNRPLAAGRTAAAAAVKRPTATAKRPTTPAAAQSRSSQGAGGGRQDVPALCRRGQLHRASIATLTEWLQQRGGGSCAGRPSKAQLISQVQQQCLLRGEGV